MTAKGETPNRDFDDVFFDIVSLVRAKVEDPCQSTVKASEVDHIFRDMNHHNRRNEAGIRLSLLEDMGALEVYRETNKAGTVYRLPDDPSVLPKDDR